MERVRKDHTRFLFYGFVSSLVIGVILFTVTAFSTVQESRRLIEAASSGESKESGKSSAAEQDTDASGAVESGAETADAGSGRKESDSETVWDTVEEGVSAPNGGTAESQPAASEQPAAVPLPAGSGNIRALSEEEIAAIEATMDMTVRGFGTGFNEPRDEYNRNTYVVQVSDEMQAAGVNGRCFCSDVNTRRAAITFQAGYENGYTEQILNILSAYGVHSVFYITHEFGWNNPALVQRIIAEGHAVGSHTYSAPTDGIAELPLRDQMNDALRMQQYMQETFGYTMHQYNYNSGVWSMASAKMMSDMGYTVDFCSVNYEDFDITKTFDAGAILESLEQCAHNGVVYSFHMVNPVTVQILPGLIDYLNWNGYEIVMLP